MKLWRVFCTSGVINRVFGWFHRDFLCFDAFFFQAFQLFHTCSTFSYFFSFFGYFNCLIFVVLWQWFGQKKVPAYPEFASKKINEKQVKNHISEAKQIPIKSISNLLRVIYTPNHQKLNCYCLKSVRFVVRRNTFSLILLSCVSALTRSFPRSSIPANSVFITDKTALIASLIGSSRGIELAANVTCPSSSHTFRFVENKVTFWDEIERKKIFSWIYLKPLC